MTIGLLVRGIIISLFLLTLISCSNSANLSKLQSENVKLQKSVDSLSIAYGSIHSKYDSLVTAQNDTVYITGYRDSVVIRDSVVVQYEKKSVPRDVIEKYLNLFFETDHPKDTVDLRYNISIFNGKKLSYMLDSNYVIADSAIGWRIDWYKVKSQKSKDKSKNPRKAKDGKIAR
jgi:hypothetical protein